MVHIKRVELTNFKSFGGTTAVPLLPGFTVVSGPNGSGKSNILDALLFCMGLSTSKGMRAERLPDLVNNKLIGRQTVETIVTVTFDLEEEDSQEEETRAKNGHIPEEGDEFYPQGEGPEENGQNLKDSDSPELDRYQTVSSSYEWSVSRKLRVTKQGTYTSTYYVNGEPCTLTKLHEALNRNRIYPEGYNVVLQGDVTSIISMKPRERREIIDELAGVAQFDRKISLAKEKLDEVKEQEERSQIVQKELTKQCDRLSQDSIKAKKYQEIRTQLEQKSEWFAILKWQKLQKQEWQLREAIEAGDRQSREYREQLDTNQTKIQQAKTELDELNAQVKALGEEELLALQSGLATQEAERRQLQQRQEELSASREKTQAQIARTEAELQQHQKNLELIASQHRAEKENAKALSTSRDEAREALNQNREKANAIASNAEAWVQEQTELHRKIETIQKTLNPHRTEQATIAEKVRQLESQLQEQKQFLQDLEIEIETQKQSQESASASREKAKETAETLSKALKTAEEELELQKATETRLLQEQRDRQRKLDKLEAQQQALQEASGSYAAKILTNSSLSGICGLVCQLGRVEVRYQLALEIAAGGRLGNMVVENDKVGAAGIQLLKQQRAGRMTFLPMNKIRAGRSLQDQKLRVARGFVDYAVNLIECDRRYRDIFSYVFGNTVVFATLEDARRHLGVYRMVTLEGEILETSGAMTGGSVSRRSTLHFDTASDSDEGNEAREIEAHQRRLQEIETILGRCSLEINKRSAEVKERSRELMEAKQYLRETQLKAEQIDSELAKLTKQQNQGRSLFAKNTEELAKSKARLTSLEEEIPTQESQLEKLRQTLGEMEESQTHSEWQQMRLLVRDREEELEKRETALQQALGRLRDLENQQQRLQEKIEAATERLSQDREREKVSREDRETLQGQLAALGEQIQETKNDLSKIEQKLGTEKQKRDEAESQLRELYLAKQQAEWQLQKLEEGQLERRQQLSEQQSLLEAQKKELPEPLPEVPQRIKLGDLEKEVRSLQKELQALEPVNMLALEEFEQTKTRLEELTEKLSTLEGERTELLLRIENFTTLRTRSFFEAFNVVNENFQTIFAELSQGDGFLQLDDPEEPFNSGLQLVAHPKGKPVQRLASMSGGEKSLTALSFIFALQRFRPSPFYAFDEVDMFLDGANVERLAKMIKRESQQAQFIVVSLRRPMMEASERTIGVTQARGAHTQVLGIKLPK
ncbi:MAG: chromosome segregation protein SMC [Cyanobacteriota bacterium]|nr:chromosome segregation protein SMC [Cyanobacteriota bacterium]